MSRPASDYRAARRNAARGGVWQGVKPTSRGVMTFDRFESALNLLPIVARLAILQRMRSGKFFKRGWA